MYPVKLSQFFPTIIRQTIFKKFLQDQTLIENEGEENQLFDPQRLSKKFEEYKNC